MELSQTGLTVESRNQERKTKSIGVPFALDISELVQEFITGYKTYAELINEYSYGVQREN